MAEDEILQKFLREDVQLSPEAFSVLRARVDGKQAADRVLVGLMMMPEKPLVITKELVLELLEKPVGEVPQPPPELPSLEVEKPKFEVPAALELVLPARVVRAESRVEVMLDITGRSYGEGEVKDFVELFRDRYEKLDRILRQRVDLRAAAPLSRLGGFEEGERVRVTGMVAEKRETRSGHLVLELEDPGGRATAWVFKGRRELMRKAAEVVSDEVVGIEAVLRKGDGAPRLLVNDLMWPDVPSPRVISRAEEPVCAVLISDLHVGSEMFLEDAFKKFLKWLRGEAGSSEERELAERVRYLIIAGDIVDGIGVYPRQEEELLITDVFKQYEAAAELLAGVPEHITMVIAPGNHDAVRPCEPQPAISKDVAGGLYELNAVMVGNPVLVTLYGVKFLVYHGRSFDDLVATIPEASRQNPMPLMQQMLRKRHLAPIYGGKTATMPEEKDYLVIEEVPDVLHCGHLHVFGHDRYRDVVMVNSGAFQEMTIYMKSVGVRPTPGIVPVVDLQTHDVKVMRFA